MTKKDLPIYGLFFLLTILITLPAILHLSSNLIGDSGDGYQFLGFQYLAKREFFAGRFPFGITNFWRYPYGVNVSNIIDSSFLISLGLLFYQFTTNPILVYNLSTLSMVLLNLIIAYHSFRLFFNRLPAVIGAIIYGLSFYSIAKLGGHMNLYSISGFALFFFSIIKLYQSKGKSIYFLLAGSATLFIAFSSLQYPLFFIGSLPFLLPLAWFLFPKQTKRFVYLIWERKNLSLITICSIFCIFFLFHGQKFLDLLTGEVAFPINEITTVPLINFLIPNIYLRAYVATFSNNTKEWIEYVVAFGYVELILFTLAIFLVPASRTKTFLLISAGLLFIIALGKQDFLPQFWPYQYLFPHFPYRGIIEPGRFFIIFYLFSTVLIVMFLNRFKDNTLLLLIIALLVIERLPTGFRLSPNHYDQTFIEKVKEPPSSAILDLPVFTEWWNGQVYDIYSVYYEKPIVNGYIQWSGETNSSKMFIEQLKPLSCPIDPEHVFEPYNEAEAIAYRDNLIRQMKFYDIRTVVIHKDLNYFEPQCSRARQYIDLLLQDTNQWLEVYQSDSKIVMWLRD